MMDLFGDFIAYMNQGKLPNYFLLECDLLATVGHDELQVVHKSINDILLNPIAAVLKCPSVPNEIYGDILPGELEAVFSHVSTHPCCEQSRDEFLLLLSRLDEWRQHLYRKQLREDDNENKEIRTSGRPELRGLVRIFLKQTKHIL